MTLKLHSDSESTPIANGASNNGLMRDNSCPNQTVCDQVPKQNNDQQAFKFSKATRRKKCVLMFCVVANFMATSAKSLLVPFFPLVAQTKGMSIFMIGFVFGVYNLVVFLAASVIGKYMTRIGVKFVYLSGVFVGGCCAILFGALDKAPAGISFTIMSILVRCVEALGFAAFMTASMTIASSEFPDHVGSVLALLKTGSGIGLMTSPIIGGFLYDLGGFGLPFYTLGVVNLLSGVVFWKLIPDIQNCGSKSVHDSSVFHLFRSSLLVFALFVVFLTMAGVNVLVSTIAIYLQQFDVSASTVGFMNAILASVYITMTPIAGYITDVKDSQSALLIFGLFVAFISWLLCGPSPVLPFINASLWSFGVGLFLLGISFGCMLVPSMKCMVNGALDLNHEKNTNVYALVSGLFNSAHALGGFVGPVAMGNLIQEYGFPKTFTGLGLVNFFLFIFSIGFFMFRSRKGRQIDKAKECEAE